MKGKFFAALAGAAVVAAVATGCIQTVSGTWTPDLSPGQDSLSGRYARSLDQVYRASVQVIQTDGVLLTEFIPHDTTNTVRALYGKVNERRVWVRVSEVDPQITQVTVETRTKSGFKDIDLAHELEKEIGLQLAR
ncbi:MAG: hypothetical protein KGR98_03715 [Verrucomicrobia bacterium]|nr:hypothetical protein [Verrucomicrobiota bacterium]MDE3100467.1 hypothetical protein [Verrucomicrobiota bacterium]